jgi:predicted RNA methylase
MNAIVPRATIDTIEAQRARALALYGEAFDLLAEANRAQGYAVQGNPCGPYFAAGGGFARDEKRFGINERDQFLERARQDLDRGVWRYLIDATNLERLMDHTERQRFREQLAADPPPATADNLAATLDRFMGEAHMIFQRGVATAFSALDRRFRSHDGFKIGGRIVLSRALSEFGGWNHYTHADEHLRDVERAFYILDGKVQPDRSGGIIGAIDAARYAIPGFGARAYTAEDDYFSVRAFKNGNAHVYFKRDDLVDRVNRLLADYYGASLGAAPDVADRTHAAKTTPAKNFGHFDTPAPIVARVIEEARLGGRRRDDWRPLRILEPSAGRGNIALAAAALGHMVTCVEIQHALCRELHDPSITAVLNADFLTLTPAGLGDFDVILMNPPFDRGRDVDHVTHALRFLRPGGRLVAIMSAGVEFRQDRKTADFRAAVERAGGQFRDLPPGAFAEAGTNVNTVIVSLSR